jgi:hypothetical protein
MRILMSSVKIDAVNALGIKIEVVSLGMKGRHNWGVADDAVT